MADTPAERNGEVPAERNAEVPAAVVPDTLQQLKNERKRLRTDLKKASAEIHKQAGL